MLKRLLIEDGSTPGGGGGQADLESDPNLEGQSNLESDPNAGKGTSFTEDDYKHLQKGYTQSRQLLSKLEESAREWGYGDVDGNVSEEELQQHQQELREIAMGNLDGFKARLQAQEQNKNKTGNNKGGEPPAKPAEKVTDPAALASLRMSVNANKGVHRMEFMRAKEKIGETVDETELKELDRTLQRIMRESPALLENAEKSNQNWFEIAESYNFSSNPNARAKYDQKVIEREKQRQEKLKTAGGGLTGGAPATGNSKSIEEELQKRFNG